MVQLPDSLPARMFLLAYDLKKQRLSLSGGRLGYVLRAAALTELFLDGRLTEERRKPTPDTPGEDPYGLVAQIAASRPRSWQYWVRKDSKAMVVTIRDELAVAGYIRVRHRKVLGLFPSEQITVKDPRVVKTLWGGGCSGSTITSGGLALTLPMLARDTPYRTIALCMVLVSIGSSLFATGNTAAILAAVPSERLGVVNGLRMTIQNVGNVLSTALCLALATSALARGERHLLYEGAVAGLSPGSLGDLVDGYQRAFALLLGASLIATFMSFSNTRGRTPVTPGVPLTDRLDETGPVPK